PPPPTPVVAFLFASALSKRIAGFVDLTDDFLADEISGTASLGLGRAICNHGQDKKRSPSDFHGWAFKKFSLLPCVL
ncbi:MAG TPA: hypothetical protein VGW12_09625, partial [Pyrinomonadaceae bacterium]|nr:hypothetical protein [Pyrinomonadaceae bacterium]